MAKKEQKVKRKGLLSNAVDYDFLDYYIPLKDGKPIRTAKQEAQRLKNKRILWFAIGAIVCAVAAWIFFEFIPACIVIGIIGGFVFVPLREKSVIAKRKKVLNVQFKEFLTSLATSISSGSNTQRSIAAAYKDMTMQFSAEADITNEVGILIIGMANSLKLEDLLTDFAERSGIDDIRDFASVFMISNQRGGNLADVIKNTVKIINDKVEVEMEIETMVSGQKLEQNAMLVMPVVFVALLKSFGEGMVDLSSPLGIIAMIIALVMFAVAYFVGKIVLNIKV